MPSTITTHICLEKERIDSMEKKIIVNDIYVKILIGVAVLLGTNTIVLLGFLANEYIKKWGD